jgi:diacylglycerol kinase (ATP)
MTHRVLLIVNPAAACGRVLGRWEELRAELSARGMVVDHVFSGRPGDAVDLARQAGLRYDVVGAVGGDGTVNEVVSGLLASGETKAALAVVPLGTGNDVARLLQIRSVSEAVDALAEGTTRSLDAIEVRCHESGGPTTRYALLYAAVGFAGELLKRTTPVVKRFFGPRYCYSVGFFRALVGFQSPMMRVRCDGRPFDGRLFLVSAGNAEIVGSGMMRLSPGARVDDGMLNVNVIGAMGRLEAARCFPRVLAGTHTAHPKVRYFAARSVTVECEPAAGVQMDGELFGRTPGTFEVRPAAIRAICARTTKGKVPGF